MMSTEDKIYKQRRKKLNESFFDDLSPNSAYVFGVICTDGTISKNLREVSIASKDKILLLRIKDLLKSEHKIGRLRIQGKYYWRLSLTSTRLVSSLLRRGLMPNKSLILSSVDISNNLFSPFLAGVIDGDGTVRTDRNGKRLRITIGMGCLGFMKFLQKHLTRREIKAPIYVYDKGRQNPLYSLETTGLNAEKMARLAYFSGHDHGLIRKKSKASPFMIAQPQRLDVKDSS